MMTGWIDASGAAAAAMVTLDKETGATPLVSFDDDTYIDYRARRPTLELRDGVSTRLMWAKPELKVGRDLNGRDVLLLTGPEPDMAWHRFASTVADLAEQLTVAKMAALGAYPFAAPHTRAPHLSVTSPSAEVVAELPFRTSSVDVPAGMAAALEHSVWDRGIPALGIWSQVPHYVATMSYPAASVALLEGLGIGDGRRHRCRRPAPRGRAAARAPRPARRGQRGARGDGRPVRTALRRRPSSRARPGAPADGGLELRSGDEIAGEIERFLRDQGKS